MLPLIAVPFGEHAGYVLFGPTFGVKAGSSAWEARATPT